MNHLLTKYPDARLEWSHGKTILAGAFLPINEVKDGQKWLSSSGNLVEIIGVYPLDGLVRYRYGETFYEKENLSFQARYCLVLEENSQPTNPVYYNGNVYQLIYKGPEKSIIHNGGNFEVDNSKIQF